MNHQSIALEAARTLTHALIEIDVPPDDIADAMIVEGLAVWAADTGRKSVAESLIRTWAEVRDASN